MQEVCPRYSVPWKETEQSMHENWAYGQRLKCWSSLGFLTVSWQVSQTKETIVLFLLRVWKEEGGRVLAGKLAVEREEA